MKKKLIVLGTGFGAFSLLKRLDTSLYDVEIVSPRNHFLFTPLLCSTTVGTIEFRSIIEPIRNIKDTKFYQAYCLNVSPVIKFITCEDVDTKTHFDLQYDILIISVGEVTNTFGIEGVNEFAYFLREVSDARKIRNKVIDCFENASIPNLDTSERKDFLRFVVCGGGPTGVEFAAELHDFIVDDVRKKYPALEDEIEVILIEAGGKILNTFDEKLSEYTLKIFKRQKINVKMHSYITRVTEKEIYLNDGSHFNYGLLVWSAGNASNPLINNLSLGKNERNKLLIDENLNLLNHKDIYALGDCCEFEVHPYPATAQVAQQQGKYLAKMLNRFAKGKQERAFRFRDFGMLAYIGSHKALANNKQIAWSGFTTWIAWRSIYLTKLVSLKNKVLVLFDWFKTFVFGRDVSNF